MEQSREEILLVGISGSVNFINKYWSKEICEEVSCVQNGHVWYLSLVDLIWYGLTTHA